MDGEATKLFLPRLHDTNAGSANLCFCRGGTRHFARQVYSVTVVYQVQSSWGMKKAFPLDPPAGEGLRGEGLDGGEGGATPAQEGQKHNAILKNKN